MTVTTKPGLTGETTYKPLKPLRGECRMFRLNLWFCRVLFDCTRTMGAASTRHSLRPLVSDEGGSIKKLGRNAPRERRVVSTVPSRCILRDARKRAPQDEVVASGTMPTPHGEEARKRRLEPCRPQCPRVRASSTPRPLGSSASGILDRAGRWRRSAACAPCDAISPRGIFRRLPRPRQQVRKIQDDIRDKKRQRRMS